MQMCNWKCREREGETERERGAKASTEEVMAKKFAQIDKIHQFTNSRNPNSSAFKKERKKEKENYKTDSQPSGSLPLVEETTHTQHIHIPVYNIYSTVTQEN